MGASALTPYRILHVPTDANDAKLHVAFRRHIHALKRGRLSDEQFRMVCRAYECLTDHDQRKVFDATEQWVHELSLAEYTLQQLANERILCSSLRVSLIVALPGEINAQDPRSGYTLLYCAARAGNDEAVEIAIERGVDLDSIQRDGSTALHAASFYGHSSVLHSLLWNGADFSIRDNCGKRAAKQALNRRIKQVFVELKKSPFVQVAAKRLSWLKTHQNEFAAHINHRYYRCYHTLLHCACKKGFLEIVRWLVEQCSADLNIVDLKGNSALHLATTHGHRSIVEYLLERGANPHLLNHEDLTAQQIAQQSNMDFSSVFRRIYDSSMFEMAEAGVTLWFEHYFGTNSPDTSNEHGTTLLYVACRHGQVSVARWLLEHGANVDLPLGEGSRSTPLHGAVFHDHTDVVELLLSYHADVTIQNAFGGTVFDECQSDLARALLESYRDRLGGRKLIAIHIYEKQLGERSNEQPIARLTLPYDATDRDLLERLRPFSNEQTGYFTLAGRALHFDEKDPTILTAVYRARYSDSRFIETPLHLTFCAGFLRPLQAAARRRDLDFDYARLEDNFQMHGKSYHIETKKGTHSNHLHCIDDLSCSFVTDSNEDNLSVDLQLLPLPSPDVFDLPGCVALFKISCSSASASKARVKATDRRDIRCRLYVSAAPSPYWLTTGLDHRQLPMVNGIYGLFRPVDIIPGLLSLPLDMCIAQSIGQPLLPRATPIPCKCLQLRPHRSESFPLIVYHGTLISHIRSILTDGLVLPETVVSSGHFVKPPAHHVPLHTDYGPVRNFAGAIFVSPSIFYSSTSSYATEFQFEGATYLPVLECSIKTNSYTVFARTVPTYIGHPDDNLEALEWRIADPSDIEINAVLFVKKNFARDIKASSRLTWL